MYELTLDERSEEQVNALPASGRDAWRELSATLEVAPWNGRPLHPGKPDGLLTWQFGAHGEGIAYYLVIDHDRQVAVLEVQWLA